MAGWINQLYPDVPVTIENAKNVHLFIQSLNLPHKTDRLDAQAIALFGSERQPKTSKRPSKTILKLRELSRTRTALVKSKVDFKNRQECLIDPFTIEINKQMIAVIEAKIKEVELKIKECVMKDDEIRGEIELMCTLPAVSFISACDIIAELGSLKQYSAKRIILVVGTCSSYQRIRNKCSFLFHEPTFFRQTSTSPVP